VRELEAHPECAFVSGHIRRIAADGSPLRIPPQALHKAHVEGDYYTRLLRYNYIWTPGSVMYRRSVFDSVGGFDTSVNATADWDLYLRIARDYPVRHHGEVVLDYRRHGASMTGNPALMLKATVAVLRRQRKHVRGNKRYEKASETGLRGGREYYGVPLADEVRGHLRGGEWKRALRGMLVLLRYYPRGLTLLGERRMERHRERDAQRRELTRQIRASRQELGARERRLEELGRVQELEGAMVKGRQEARLLRRRIRRLKRRMQNLDQRALDQAVEEARPPPSQSIERMTNNRNRPTNPADAADLGSSRPQPAGGGATKEARWVSRPAVALLPWGDVWEDFLDMIGVSLDEFCTKMTGGWLFGYVGALEQVGIRTVLVLWSREARRPHRRLHVPTGTTVWVLPPARAHRAARRFACALGASERWAQGLRRIALLAARYTATPPRRLASVLRKEQCGAVLVQEYEDPRFDVCVLLGRWLGLPVIATFQGGDRPGTRLEGRVRPRTVPAAAGLLIGSRREAEAVTERYRLSPGAVTLVPNPIDVHEWTPSDRAAARSALGLPADAAVACWHGRTQVGRKGLDILVEAWRLVCAERPGMELRLLLCGGGRGAKRLRRLIARADLRGVHWRDEYVTNRAVVRQQLAASDVFVLPSRHEGFAVAPMEAMACGRPVVASDVPGAADLLAGGERAGGVVVPREDPGALATALGQLLDDRALAARLGEAARQRVAERYSLEAVGRVLAAALHGAAPDRFPAPSSPL
jgi:glycosyltransferase involved in cell wall biosynthesis/uncharacterized coiled-coil protein SlyX